MMKYLKAEAEIIKFDNSDVVTASGDYIPVENCAWGPGNGWVCAYWPGKVACLGTSSHWPCIWGSNYNPVGGDKDTSNGDEPSAVDF